MKKIKGDSNTGDYNAGDRNTGDRNTGYRNTGYRNTGDSNTGDSNAGDRNTGYRNTGDSNAGDRNTGYRNTGDSNAGYRNTGDSNTGDYNAGDRNTGDRNTGYRNTGYRNTGDSNTGDSNAGDRNTGDYNTGDYNTGYCNTITPEEIIIFNRPAKRVDWERCKKPDWMYVNLTKWVCESDMTPKEKGVYTEYITIGGYLKFYSSLQHAYIESWEKADNEDRELTFKLPNFDVEVFKEIFGFDPRKEQKKNITIDGKEIEISEESFEELKKQLNS